MKVKEWNLLRAIACLSIVFLHSTTQIGRSVGYGNIEEYFLIRVILTYATPTFIVLSIIILANKYKENLPADFFTKRAKFIILPYISFAIIDALVVNALSVRGIDISDKIINNLMGNFIGYFILIIFQFYILHYLVLKYKVSVIKLFPISILVMLAHLAFLGSDHPLAIEYGPYLKLPFTAWFGYYTSAFLIGKHYREISRFLKDYRWLTVIVLLYTLFFIHQSFEAGYNRVDSRRLDIFPLSLSISFAVLAWGQVIKDFKFVNLISNYSLGIYLVHWQVQRVITPYVTEALAGFSPTVLIFGVFFVSLMISLLIIKIVSLLPFGKYIVGNTKRSYKKPAVMNSL